MWGSVEYASVSCSVSVWFVFRPTDGSGLWVGGGRPAAVASEVSRLRFRVFVRSAGPLSWLDTMKKAGECRYYSFGGISDSLLTNTFGQRGWCPLFHFTCGTLFERGDRRRPTVGVVGGGRPEPELN